MLSDGVMKTHSIFSAQHKKQNPKGGSGAILDSPFPPDAAAYAGMVQAVREHGIVAGILLSENVTLTLILVSLDRKEVAAKSLPVIVAGIKAPVEKALTGTGLGVRVVTGSPARFVIDPK